MDPVNPPTLAVACLSLLACRQQSPQDPADSPAPLDTSSPVDTSTPPDTETGDTGEIHDGVTPVYVTFFSHNEDAPYWKSLVDDLDEYARYRADLRERVELLWDHGATLNWETDEAVLRAMARNEVAQDLSTTGDKSILPWMVEDMGVHVDPHTHQHGPYNYADIAYLIGTLGVESGGVVGGLALMGCAEKKGEFVFTDWNVELGIGADGLIQGRRWPQASWRPTVLTQVAMADHHIDEFSSGVWRPEPGDFYASDGDGLAYVGQGYPRDRGLMGDSTSSGVPIVYEDLGYIQELVGMIESGRRSGGIYTASVRLLDQPLLAGVQSTNALLLESLQVLQPLVDSGQVVYLDYEGVVKLWERDHASRPSRVSIDEFSAYDRIFEPVDDECWGDS